MFIVHYRPHNRMICETVCFGPFRSDLAAHVFLCGLPALGIHIPDGCTPNSGVKFIEELTPIDPITVASVLAGPDSEQQMLEDSAA